MNAFLSICTLFTLLGFSPAKTTQMKIFGDVEHHKLIDNESVCVPAKRRTKVSKTITFPPQGPLYSKYVITGYKQIDETDSPNVRITSGGIFTTHISMVITSKPGKSLATNFAFFGEKASS